MEPVEFERLNTYLGNLANAATNKRAVLSQLTNDVAALTTANAQLSETKKLPTANNKKLRKKLDGVPSSGSGRSSRSGITFTKVNPGRFDIGAYFHSHGFRLGKPTLAPHDPRLV